MALLMMSGCVSVPINYAPAEIAYSEPPLNKEVQAGLGESLVRQGRLVEYDAIYLPALVKINWAYKLRRGYYVKQGKSDAGNFYVPSAYGEGGAIVKARIADQVRVAHVPATKDKLCVVTVYNIKICTAEATWETKKQAAVSDRYFQQRLIYGGGHGNKINIVYRELTNNRARLLLIIALNMICRSR